MKKSFDRNWGGWDGHDPEQVANAYKDILESEDFDVEVADTLSAFEDEEN